MVTLVLIHIMEGMFFVTNKVDELNLLKSKYASLDTDVVIDGE